MLKHQWRSERGSWWALGGHWPSAWWASSGSTAYAGVLHSPEAQWAPAPSGRGDGWKRGAAASHCAHGVCAPREQPSCHPRMASELSSAIQRSHYLEKENWSYRLAVLPLTSDSILASNVILRVGIFSNSNYLRTLLELAYACQICSQADIGQPCAVCSRGPHRPSLRLDLKDECPRQREQPAQSL